MPRAGKLRHPIVIEEPTGSQNSMGEALLVWSEFASRFAGFEPLAGREYFEGAARRSEATARFWLRDDVAGVNDRMRVAHEDSYYNIESVIRPEKPGGYLQIMVRDAV